MKQATQYRNSPKYQSRIIAVCVLIIPLITIGCSNPNPAHDAMLGHWEAVYDTTNDVLPTLNEIYVSKSFVWSLNPGNESQKLNYSVSDYNSKEFSSKLVIKISGEKPNTVIVRFSSDTSEMYFIPPANSRYGASFFRRVDKKTEPPQSESEITSAKSKTMPSYQEHHPVWLERYSNIGTDYGDDTTLNFLTGDPSQQVKDFFIKSLKSYGFVIDESPESGKFATIGAGKFIPIKATRPFGKGKTEFELAISEQSATSTQVVGSWNRVLENGKQLRSFDNRPPPPNSIPVQPDNNNSKGSN